MKYKILLFVLLFSRIIAYDIFMHKDNTSIKIENIKNQTFTKLNKSYINEGITSDTIWLKIILDKDEQNKILLLDNTTLDSIKLFENSHNTIYHTGDHYPISSKDIDDINHAFKITSGIYYLKINTENSMTFKIKILDKNEYQTFSHTKTLFLTFFLGFMISLLIYNSFIYLIIREKSYLFYILYHFSFILFMLSMSGFGYYYIWQDNIYINEFVLKTLDDMTIIFAMLFAKYFLDTKKNFPLIDKIIKTLIVLELVILIISNTSLHIQMASLVMYVMLGAVITIFVLNFLAVKQKLPIARYYALGWSLMLSAVFITLLQNFGIIGVNFITTWILYIAAMLEVVVFSIALAKRIELLKQKETNLLEVHHRIKNNLQVISSFVMMMGIKDDNLRVKLIPLQDKIRVISELHHHLYMHNTTTIDIRACIETLVDELSSIYNVEKIKFKYEIEDIKLDIETSTTIGLIISELISNAFKYAFDETIANPTITINLKKDRNQILLCIKDNGIGLETNNIEANQSFGLKLIKRMVEKNGEFIMNSKNNLTQFFIKLSH